MENTNQHSGTTPKEKRQKNIIILLIAIIVVLGGLLIYSLTRITDVTEEKDQTELFRQELQIELNELMKEHNQIKNEYGEVSDLLVEKDSLIQVKAQEIQELIYYRGSYYKTKKKLDLLRNTTKSYLHQIDSLLTVNAELQDENIAIKSKYTSEKARTEELTKTLEEKDEKIIMGSALQAYNLTAIPYRTRWGGSKEVETDKAGKVERVLVCFTLSENPITPSGNKIVYVRIARPDNVIISQGKTDMYSFDFEGKKIQYSIKKEITYTNKTQNLCLSWKKLSDDIPAMEGTYHVSVFCDGSEIGSTSFSLK